MRHALLFLSALLAVHCGDSSSDPEPTSMPNPSLGGSGAVADAGRQDFPDASMEGASDGGNTNDATCPASVSEGGEVGQVAPEVRLTDCDGVEHSLRDFCGQPAWLFLYADWCSSCRSKAVGVAARQERYAQVGSWFVITENRSGGAPDRDFCTAIQRQYNLPGPVLIDPSGELQSALSVPSNDINVVLDSQQVIQGKPRYASPAAVDSLIESVLE